MVVSFIAIVHQAVHVQRAKLHHNNFVPLHGVSTLGSEFAFFDSHSAMSVV